MCKVDVCFHEEEDLVHLLSNVMESLFVSIAQIMMSICHIKYYERIHVSISKSIESTKYNKQFNTIT